ncbi:hypothetical protein CONPUDRAFT_84465 [Coniophora puteana RWD-64-598 SS2]|uniref:DUF6533 domain-containing protein n=1 Tax=Coniophora puteana (strain RWD-64-598) TaxID=741705 RepID=A0A5M3ME68_CONPW|nr:uncharacterized protein CONPUDRAFT_84465 [Coniophora puteana RWD-64-598 SS2]EIW77347.1 hypothetical protein CONPUDRAFT_84465 [Coniophora puteana RWD-64-598 SS2]
METFSEIFAAQQILLHAYTVCLSFTILCYDHLMTFAEEIAYIWRRPFTTSSILFFLNRYVGLFGNAAALAALFVSATSSCQQWKLYHQLLLVTNQVIVCGILTVRTYALYNRDKYVLAFMLTSASLLAGAAGWSLTGQQSTSYTLLPGCNESDTFMTGVHIATAWEALFVYDSAVFILTMVRMIRTGFFRNFTNRRRVRDILFLVWRDGAIYYLVMVSVNASNILTFYLASSLNRGFLSTFASCVSICMISRLMLNLHQSADVGILSTMSPGERRRFLHRRRPSKSGAFPDGGAEIEEATTAFGGGVELTTQFCFDEEGASVDYEQELELRELERQRDIDGDIGKESEIETVVDEYGSIKEVRRSASTSVWR